MKNDKNVLRTRVMAMIKDPYFASVMEENTQWVFSRSRFWSNLGACLLIYWLLLAIWVSVSGFGTSSGALSLSDWMFTALVGLHHLVVVLFAVISAHVEVSK